MGRRSCRGRRAKQNSLSFILTCTLRDIPTHNKNSIINSQCLLDTVSPARLWRRADIPPKLQKKVRIANSTWPFKPHQVLYYIFALNHWSLSIRTLRAKLYKSCLIDFAILGMMLCSRHNRTYCDLGRGHDATRKHEPPQERHYW